MFSEYRTAVIDGDVLLHMSIWNSPDLEDALESLEVHFEAVMEGSWSEDYVMAFGGPNNFRDVLFSEYKKSASRAKSKSTRPEWFGDLKSEVTSLYENSVICDGYEADDMVRIWATELAEWNKDFIVCTVDKDLDCIPGNHYNPRKSEIYWVSPEYSEMFYWKQLLMGDTVDNIPGVEGIGPKKAEKIIEDCKTREDYEHAVFKVYYDKYPEDGFDRMLLNGKLLHMWRSMDDHFSVERSKYDSIVKG